MFAVTVFYPILFGWNHKVSCIGSTIMMTKPYFRCDDITKKTAKYIYLSCHTKRRCITAHMLIRLSVLAGDKFTHSFCIVQCELIGSRSHSGFCFEFQQIKPHEIKFTSLHRNDSVEIQLNQLLLSCKHFPNLFFLKMSFSCFSALFSFFFSSLEWLQVKIDFVDNKRRHHFCVKNDHWYTFSNKLCFRNSANAIPHSIFASPFQLNSNYTADQFNANNCIIVGLSFQFTPNIKGKSRLSLLI